MAVRGAAAGARAWRRRRDQFTGSYRQVDAPALYRRADLLCYNARSVSDRVIEAMACGLPLCSATGGVPELVGDAGAGVETEVSFERDHPPAPEALAAAVRDVASRLPEFSKRARAQAVAHLDLQPRLARHRPVFTTA